MVVRPSSSGSPPVADYALIGDCHTAALIGRDGSVDWYCPGRFDAPAALCRLLDANGGGFLRLAPNGHFSVERRYRGPTNVLETTFAAAGGRVRVTDCMPIHQRMPHRRGYDVGGANRLLRLVEGIAGEVEMELHFKPTLDYGRAHTELVASAGEGAIARAGEDFLTLTLAWPGLSLQPDGQGGLRGQVRVRAGERSWAALTYAADADRARAALASTSCDEELARTLDYWERWAAQCTYRGPYREQVLRSALTLKLLTYEPTGAVVAAPTTSLPEEIGGERNWDYRYTWLRDAALIVYALMTIGYGDEAADFIDWLHQTLGSAPRHPPRIMYGIDGRRAPPEQVLEHLAGYRGSRPVRIGNAAADQRQLDIFGEVVLAAALHYRRGSDRPHEGQPAHERTSHRPSAEAWGLVRHLVDQAAQHWTESGSGIWEVRGGPRPFLYGKLMCWAALESGLRLAREHRLAAPVDAWRRTREQIRQAILERGYDSSVGGFTQAFGSSSLDASALVIPRIGFLPATDPRVQSTVEQIQRRLTRHGLVYRYRGPDGLAGGEATFTLCTFWLVDALALGGRVEEAHALFERVLGFASDLGLLAEEIDPDTGEQLGNFPQGFSHLALIRAAVNLAKASRHGAEHQAETDADRAGRASRAASQHSAPARRQADGPGRTAVS
ncbi:MAG: glycoside hydrolase family 15 protein [Chloroflexota bacterium]|nr:glycoside hydrolase family 15 protein [Chloroflexota bacterium]